MKVITPGKVYMFKCSFCGCEFVEGKAKLNADSYFNPKLKCPTCGDEVEGHESDELDEFLKKYFGEEKK